MKKLINILCYTIIWNRNEKQSYYGDYDVTIFSSNTAVMITDIDTNCMPFFRTLFVYCPPKPESRIYTERDMRSKTHSKKAFKYCL